jgi:TetR/AcrR family tetracycline transcriptional repressor
MTHSISPARTRGSRAGLDLAKIVRTARGMAPGDLTMKAVAGALGVDPKALNYHVEDRESLLALVAADAFTANFATVRIADDCSWQEACRIFAAGFAASLIETSLLVEHFRLGHSLAAGFLEPGEIILKKMIEAGFGEETAARLSLLLGNICIGYARDYVIASRNGRILAGNLHDAIEACENQNFENLSRVIKAGIAIDSETQLGLGVDVFLKGAEALLSQAGSKTR